MTRRYYSVRTGKNPLASQLDLPMFLRLFGDLYKNFSQKEYFQEAFGYYCADAGRVSGTLGEDIEAQILRRIRKSNLWTIHAAYLKYSEDDVFDIIEFLYDYVSKPREGFFHDFNNCGWHYDTFDKEAGRQEFRNEINDLLKDYAGGYELSTEGEILELADAGLENLFQANLPTYDPDNVESRVGNAILKFRRYRSSSEDRRDAVRDLADVLEFLRPKLKTILTKKDENDIFMIANNFGIRHHEETQKTDYDKSIWYSWMFYYYLATIHATLRLMAKHQQSNSEAASKK